MGVLAVILVVSSAIFFVPGPLAETAGRDAWLAPLIAVLPGMAIAHGLSVLYFRRGQDPVERLRARPWLRAAAGLSIVAYAVHLGVLVLAETIHVLVEVMPETPLPVFAAMLAVAAAVLAVYGRATLSWASLMVFPVILVAAVANVALAIPLNADFETLRPFLERGVGPVLAAVPPVLAWMGETLLLVFWAEAVGDRQRVVRYLAAGMLAVSALLAGVAAVAVAAMGPQDVARSFVPAVTLARLVRVVPLLSRLETAVLSAWLLGIYVKLGIIAYAAGVACREALGLRRGLERPLAAAAAGVSGVLAVVLFPRATWLLEYLRRVWPAVGVGATVLILTLGLIPAGGRARGETR